VVLMAVAVEAKKGEAEQPQDRPTTLKLTTLQALVALDSLKYLRKVLINNKKHSQGLDELIANVEAQLKGVH
jgi:hypothetical protein